MCPHNNRNVQGMNKTFINFQETHKFAGILLLNERPVSYELATYLSRVMTVQAIRSLLSANKT